MRRIMWLALIVALCWWSQGVRVAAQVPISAEAPGRDVGAAAEPVGASLSAAFVGREVAIADLDIDQCLPEVAYNSQHNEHLVVWQNNWPAQTRDIRGARVTPAGTVIESFVIAEGQKDRAQPAVSYDPINDRYLVVYINDAAGDGSDWDVYGRFVPWDGPSDQFAEFAIVTWETKQWNPRVKYAYTQQEYLVVWWTEHPTVPGYVSGRRVSAAGGFPAGTFAIAVNATENRVGPDIAYNLARNEYLVVSENGLDIFGQRLRGDGVLLQGEIGIAGWPSAESSPSVAACRAADTYLVAWHSLEGDNYNVYARYLDGDGVPGTVHQIDATTGDERDIDVACNWAGTQFLLAWQTEYTNGKYGIWARTASPDGVLGQSFGVVLPYGDLDRTNASVGIGRSTYFVAWEHDRADYQDIHGRTVGAAAAYVPLTLKH